MNDKIIGKRFGKLVVVESAGIRECSDKHREKRWKCKCDCGNFTNASTGNLNFGSVMSCGCVRYKDKYIRDIFGEDWDKYGISISYWCELKYSAKRRNIKFLIKKEDAFSIFLKQNKKCALSGLDIVLEREFEKNIQTASLDRIDSDKDYTIDNIQWVHKDINRMKQDFSDEYFISICKTISNHNANI